MKIQHFPPHLNQKVLGLGSSLAISQQLLLTFPEVEEKSSQSVSLCSRDESALHSNTTSQVSSSGSVRKHTEPVLQVGVTLREARSKIPSTQIKEADFVFYSLIMFLPFFCRVRTFLHDEYFIPPVHYCYKQSHSGSKWDFRWDLLLRLLLFFLNPSLSKAVTQYRRQEWCQPPPPPSSLTSNYNDESMYFHSLAFRRFGSPERQAISFNKISPLY